jgi:hypothetical protein
VWQLRRNPRETWVSLEARYYPGAKITQGADRVSAPTAGDSNRRPGLAATTPFGLAGIWENWKAPASGEWIRTFAIITTDANELVADIHDRMPLILAPGDYARWLGEEPDPRDLMRPFPAAPMRMWPISTRVNKPENDDASIVEPIELAS